MIKATRDAWEAYKNDLDDTWSAVELFVLFSSSLVSFSSLIQFFLFLVLVLVVQFGIGSQFLLIL